MKSSDYFTISHYLPEGVYQRNKEMAKYLRNSHFCKRGLHAKEAEQQFLRYVQEMKEYGLHLYSAVWVIEARRASKRQYLKSDHFRLQNADSGVTCDVYVGISLNGIAIFERSSRLSPERQMECGRSSKNSFHRKLYANFDWLEIENLCFSKHVLCVAVRKSESLKAKDSNRVKYKFKMDGRK